MLKCGCDKMRKPQQYPDESNVDENSDSSHSLDPKVNSQEHSAEAISWDDAEKSMKMSIKFLEKSPYFSDNYVLQAMALRSDIIMKLQNQEIVVS